MGVGLILVGLASVIVSQAVIPQRRLWLIVGSCVGLHSLPPDHLRGADGGPESNDMKLITAVLVIAALLLPKLTGRTPKVAGRKVANA